MLRRATTPVVVLAAAILLVPSFDAVAQAAFFDDPTDTIQFDGQSTLGAYATFEAVVLFPADSGATGTIFNEWQAFTEDKRFWVGPSYLAGYHFNSGSVVEARPVMMPDVWHHLAYVADGGTGRLYVDGILVATGGVSSIFNGGGLIRLGAIFRDGSMNPSFIGYVESFRISDVARYTGDVFDPPMGDMESDANTLLLLNFDEEAGSETVQDSGPSALTGVPGIGFDGATAPTLGEAPPLVGCTPNASVRDLWDVARGTTVTASSGFLGDASQGLDMFGLDLSSPEPGNTLFQDGQGAGFVHWLEWEVPEPVTVRSFHLFAAHDPSKDRSFSLFRLFRYDAVEDTMLLAYEFAPPIPYGGGGLANTLSVCGLLNDFEGSRFRAEFVQSNQSGLWPGPRIFELDAFSTPYRSTSVGIEDVLPLPVEVALAPAYPNPFRGSTRIPYSMDRAGMVRVTVYDMLGREVAVLVDGARAAGRDEALFDASGLAGGVYLVRLEAGSVPTTRTVTLLR